MHPRVTSIIHKVKGNGVSFSQVGKLGKPPHKRKIGR